MSTSVYPGSLDSYTNPTASNKLNSPSHAAGETLQFDSLVALEARVGITNSAATTSVDYNLANGWYSVSETWTYVSATTFTIPVDKTGIMGKGDKIWLTQTTSKYFYIIAISFGGGVTTVTVTGGTDYTLANAAITAPYFSKMASPQGFPTKFVTSVTASAANSSTTGFLAMNGKNLIQWGACTLTIGAAGGGSGSNSTSNTTLILPNVYPDTNYSIQMIGGPSSVFLTAEIPTITYNTIATNGFNILQNTQVGQTVAANRSGIILWRTEGII